MTEAKVLVDALVEAGIVSNVSGFIAEKLITDWRVAGKVLQSMHEQEFRIYGFKVRLGNGWADNPDNPTDLPRAIIEAWYAGRETK